MDNERLIDIETRLSYTEKLVDDLNLVVTEQQQRIAQLEDLGRALAERLRALGESGTQASSSPDDERPPHY